MVGESDIARRGAGSEHFQLVDTRLQIIRGQHREPHVFRRHRRKPLHILAGIHRPPPIRGTVGLREWFLRIEVRCHARNPPAQVLCFLLAFFRIR